MRYSQLTSRISGEGSGAWDLHFEATQRRSAGEPIIVLSVGDPDFDTPAAVVQAGIDSLRAGHTHYAAIQGIPRLRQAIARDYSRRLGRTVDPGQVAVLSGAQCALFSVVQCLLDPGDDVIVIDPTYVTYEGVFGACGARMVKVPALATNGFVPRPQDIEAAITPRTRALMLNSPHNPTGAVIGLAAWERIADICCRHDLWLISDEVYADLVYGGGHVSPAGLGGMASRTATVSSLSKSHAMTGWRVGWAVGPAQLIEHLGRLSLSMLYGCPQFIQEAACVAFETELPQPQQMCAEYQRRSEAVCAALADAPGVAFFRPQSGMFVMLDVRATGLGAREFAAQLLRRHQVSLLPGDAFGRQTTGWLRLGLVEPVPVLVEACRRIGALARELGSAAATR